MPNLEMMVTFRDREAADAAASAPERGDAVWNPGGRRSVPLTIVAQDPSVLGSDGTVLTATVNVPSVRTEPGPRTHRFHVVNYDPEAGRVGPPLLSFDNRSLADRFPKPSGNGLAEHAFHAQNMYAIAARTLERFESALGRRVPWGFGSHQLYLVPHAMQQPNAFYSDVDNGLYFGFFPGASGRTSFAALSHDIVAHETSHAILDGLRRGFAEPGLPDQAAFHEALADIVALLSVFSMREVVAYAIDTSGRSKRISVTRVSADALRETVLFGLAEQFGRELSEREQSLRSSIHLDPFTAWMTDPAWEEPHQRGEVLVAAVARSLMEMWVRRLAPITEDAQTVDRDRAAEEGAKAADHLLSMVIRAIDYTPPGEFEFADFLDALLTADNEVAPDDRYNYRDGLVAAFGSYGIALPEQRIVHLAGSVRPSYDLFNYDALRSQREEAFRFLWENAELFELPIRYYTHVDSIDLAARVGIDGFIVREAVITYSQLLEATAAELARLAETHNATFALPEGLDGQTPVQIRGAGTVIFDQFGRPKYHQTKPLFDWSRQVSRLDYLVRHGRSDTSGRFGFSTGIASGERFAEAHRPDPLRAERW
jgi:hypothetical protein